MVTGSGSRYRRLAACALGICVLAVTAGCGGPAISMTLPAGGLAEATPSGDASGGATSAATGHAGTPRATRQAGTPPYWAWALGSGVTVTLPAALAPGHGSPAAAMELFLEGIKTGRAALECDALQPSVQAACKKAASKVPASYLGTVTNPGLGYLAVDGNQAVLGTTGTFCSPQQKPACYTNTDPAAIFDTGRPFSYLWSLTLFEDNSPSYSGYSLNTCARIDGKWYIYLGMQPNEA